MRFTTALLLISSLALCIYSSCKHEPKEIFTGSLCNPDSVYFKKDVLPILISSCTKSGCHDATSAADGVILTNYSNVIQTGEVKPTKPLDSKLYKVIVESSLSKRMPPPPSSALNTDHIELIRKWVAQGAKNIICIEN